MSFPPQNAFSYIKTFTNAYYKSIHVQMEIQIFLSYIYTLEQFSDEIIRG